MLSEIEVRKIFEEQIKFLKECDAEKGEWSLERYEAYDYAVAIYETLHKILQIEGKPEWCT
jgi:hypothetical protein